MAIEDGFAVTEAPKDLKAAESLAEGDKYLVQNTSVFRVFYIEVAAVDKATQKPTDTVPGNLCHIYRGERSRLVLDRRR